MFTDELRSLRSRFVRTGSDHKVTDEEIEELNDTAQSLRKELQQIVDGEIAPNNEACGVAANGMVMLQNEMKEKKLKLIKLRHMLDEARRELDNVEEQCTQEKKDWEKCREDAIQVQEDTDEARQEAINLRAEIKQMTYFQENVDTETMYRLLADVQNLKTDQERDEIRLRKLTTERNSLQSELKELEALRKAHEIVAADQQRELSEAKMTQDMYKTHQEFLTSHLKELGGDTKNVFGLLSDSFKGLFKAQPVKESIDEKPTEQTSSDLREICKDFEPMGDGNHQLKQPLKQPLERRKLEKQKSDKSKHPPQVGGVFFGTDTGAESSFVQKLPTIFKMGNNHPDVSQDYLLRKEREVEFSTDSNSVSAISAITIDEDAWTESLSDEPSR
mmetsp:Transcript_45201/g.94825  ORF Transcript_45201/g.94825 Transcript_45201/m.94825 type:complete len:389 (-) Transcript_45201:75-1241(-)|eukprot:CAMPEP_0183741188 /NCGR_PEP_ID=MMETSP0737-20130205/61504_1 /TAXON_ID=385413 /ORGANISM="Thalassiosira miniscula, Strain CCMP1093" /LENGTH=388 /DNA_ID=CAMNT_0025976445 /DNA_START=171 /DNA_END=1337 /DNA_ORIENTATION=-